MTKQAQKPNARTRKPRKSQPKETPKEVGETPAATDSTTSFYNSAADETNSAATKGEAQGEVAETERELTSEESPKTDKENSNGSEDGDDETNNTVAKPATDVRLGDEVLLTLVLNGESRSRVHTGVVVRLHEQESEDEPVYLDIKYATAGGLYRLTRIPYSAKSAPNSWRFPTP